MATPYAITACGASGPLGLSTFRFADRNEETQLEVLMALVGRAPPSMLLDSSAARWLAGTAYHCYSGDRPDGGPHNGGCDTCTGVVTVHDHDVGDQQPRRRGSIAAADAATAWSTGEPQRAGDWLQVDLGSFSRIRQVVLVAGPAMYGWESTGEASLRSIQLGSLQRHSVQTEPPGWPPRGRAGRSLTAAPGMLSVPGLDELSRARRSYPH